MLTLYVLPNDNLEKADPQKTISFLKQLEELTGEKCKYEFLNHRRLNEVEPTTPYWMYMFDNEWMHPYLVDALPNCFMSSASWDYLVFMKNINVVEKPKPVITQAPRLFKNHIKIQEGTMLPENQESLRFARIMDGWIFDETTSE